MRLAALYPMRPLTSSSLPRGLCCRGFLSRYRVATRTLPWPEFFFSLWPAQPTSWAWPTQQGLPGSASRFSARTPKPVSRQPRTAQALRMVRCVGHVVARRVPYRLGSPPPPTRKNTSLQGSCRNKKWPLLDGGRAHEDAGWCVLLAGRGSTRLPGGVVRLGSCFYKCVFGPRWVSSLTHSWSPVFVPISSQGTFSKMSSAVLAVGVFCSPLRSPRRGGHADIRLAAPRLVVAALRRCAEIATG